MIFATPLAAIGFATAAGLAAIYCFRRKSPVKTVGSLLLWPRPKTVSTQAKRRDRILLPPIFWLELLALIALVLAALTPLAWRRSAGTLHVILDESPSMSANGGEAAALARNALEKERRNGTKDAVRVRSVSSSRALARMLETAKSAAAPGDEILVLTDMPPEDGVPRTGLRWMAFGRPLSNFAITATRRLRTAPETDAIFIEVRRFGPGVDETTLTLSGLGKTTLKFDTEGRARFSASVAASAGPVTASLPEDALAIDNTATLYPPEVPSVSAAVSFGHKPCADLVRRALDATGFVTNHVAASAADVIFTDADMAPSPRQYLVRFHESSGARTTGPVWTDPTEPLLDGVALDGDPYAITSDSLPGVPVAFIGTSPLISVSSNECHVGFSNPNLPFFRSPAFPAFVQNVIDVADRRTREMRTKTPERKAALLDADESDLTKRASVSLGSHASAPDDARRNRSVAWIPALLALIALVLHFRFVRSKTTLLVAASAAIALLGPAFPKAERAGRLILIADRSRSMTEDALAGQERLIRSISAARPANAELAVVAFGRNVAVETAPGGQGFSEFIQDIDRDGSNAREAIEKAATFIEEGRPAKMVVMSDGLFSSIPESTPAAIDTYFASRSFLHDLFVASIDAPASVAPNAPVPVTAWASTSETTTNSYALIRGTNIVARGTKVFRAGLTPLVFRDFAGRPGLRRYSLEIIPAKDDPCPGNNRADFLVKVEGRRPLLYLADKPDTLAARTIRRGGVPVEAREAKSFRGGIAALEDFGGVLLDNVPAKYFPTSFLRDLAAYATDLGHGLALTGGEMSFGPGGWYKTAVEDVLPVSLELRKDHRKFSIALAIVMDRSGSMMADAGGGRTKMDMANLGAAGAIDMLNSLDEVAVIAVDSKPHLVLEMQYADQAQARRNDVLGISSMGGGIFVEEGIMAGLKELSRSCATTKHLILFADAADAEEPGDFHSYLAKARASGISVSVIGLGTGSDRDAKLLREIAEAGNGTCQFESDAKEIPRLFMQDTYLVAKTAMCTNITPVKTTSSLRQISDAIPAGLASIGGYNLTYIRDGAETAIFTEDEEHAPVLAFRRAGIGRTLAFTGELSGKHAAPLMTSKDGAEIATAIARWTLGDDGTGQSGFHFERRIEAGGIRITAVADESNPLTAIPNSGLKLVVLLDRGNDGVTRIKDALRWESSDTLSAFVPLYGKETAFPVVMLPDGNTVALAPACLPHPAEFHRHSDPSAGERAMRRLSERSGGRVRTAFNDIWDDLPSVRSSLPLAPWIYLVAAFAFLAFIFIRRLGISGTWHLHLPKRTHKVPSTPVKKPDRPKTRPVPEPAVNATVAALAHALRHSRRYQPKADAISNQSSHDG